MQQTYNAALCLADYRLKSEVDLEIRVLQSRDTALQNEIKVVCAPQGLETP